MSKLIQTQAEFRQLADERLEEARELLALKRWGGAYYLAGYAVELGLKACIIKALMMTDAFPPKDFSRDCYTHTIEKLVGLANLADHRKIATSTDPDLSVNWGVVKDWSEEKRYHFIDQSEAEELFNAIADASHGVFQWIKTQW
jgi:hypothetical protein